MKIVKTNKTTKKTAPAKPLLWGLTGSELETVAMNIVFAGIGIAVAGMGLAVLLMAVGNHCTCKGC